MRCPKCQNLETKVLDTRMGKGNLSIRRRRQCLNCETRFTTIEEILREGLTVIKRDGSREDFDRGKIIASVRKATEKRPVHSEQIEMMIAEVTDALEREYDAEIPSAAISEAIMERLRYVDDVAYVRFASCYRDFEEVNANQALADT